MAPNVLTLSNIFPTRLRRMGGSYVLDRLGAQRSMSVPGEHVPLRMTLREPLKTLFHRTGRDTTEFDPGMPEGVSVPMGPHGFWKMRHGRDLAPLINAYADAVEEMTDVSTFDVIHGHGMFRVPAGSVARELSQRHGQPFGVTAHGSDINYGMRHHAELFRETFEAARAVMYVSRPLMERAEELGAPTHNAVLTPNGVDLDTFTFAPGKRPRRVLFVGGLAEVKGADRLPHIFHSVVERVADVSFTVVGTGTLENSLRSRTTGIDVNFAGTQDRAGVAQLMRESAVLVIPSRNEGWPVVVMESYASGTPIVATDVGGLRDALARDENIVAPSPGVEDRVAARLVEMLQTPAADASLRRRAENFSWKSVVRQELSAMGFELP